MAFTAITNPEVDAKSPLDDALFAKIQADLDDLNARIVLAGASPYVFELQGKLNYAANHKRSICAGIVNEEFTPSRCRYMLKKSGTAPFGTLAFDIRKHTSPRTPITAILPQYTGATQSIGRAGSSLATQSVARITTQIATQSITFAKATNAVQSIVLLGTVSGVGTNLVQYNLATSIDSDTQNGDSILFASCTAGANNGTFVIIEKNRGGGNNVLVSNASGATQTGVAGTGQVQLMSYNFTNPVDSNFTVGLSHLFGSHTSGVNNGTFAIRAINQSGNNIWVANSTGVTQGGVAGTVDCNIWKFALSSAASTTDYIVGETALTASHSTGGNNQAALTIIAVNSGGNNLVLYNTAGAVQAGVAGNINTNRWIYAMGSDPSSQVSAGYGVYFSGHSSGVNDGYFIAKEVNRSGANNIVIYNTAGAVQGGVAGAIVTTRKVVSFSTNQSASYTATTSYVEMQGCVDPLYNYNWAYSPFQVVQVNRGGGSNYNIVIEVSATNVLAAASQVSPAGYVQTEMKSIFNTAPTIAFDVTPATVGLEPNQNIVGTSTDMVATIVPANTPLMLYLTSTPVSGLEDLTVVLR